MVSQKRIMKVIILFIVAIFLLSSGLVSVMYFVDMNKNSADENIVETLPDEDEVIDISSLGL